MERPSMGMRDQHGTGFDALDPDLKSQVEGMGIDEILDLEIRYCEWVRQLHALWKQMEASEERGERGDDGISFAG